MNNNLECIDEVPRERFPWPADRSNSAPTSSESQPVTRHSDRQPASALELAGLLNSTTPVIRVTVPPAHEEAQALGNMEFIRRMRSLVQWAEFGQRVTQTGAMRRDDTTSWMRRFGLHTRYQLSPPSMWDVRGIRQPWDIALETGMLSLTRTMVRPGPTGTVFGSDDPVAQVHLGRSIVNLILLQALSRSPVVETAGPQISTIMLRLLALLCRSEGQDLGYLRHIDRRLAHALRDPDAAERSAALLASAILREMQELDQFGLLSDLAGIARIPAGLQPAVVASINGSGNRLTVIHDTHAVPVVTDK